MDVGHIYHLAGYNNRQISKIGAKFHTAINWRCMEILLRNFSSVHCGISTKCDSKIGGWPPNLDVKEGRILGWLRAARTSGKTYTKGRLYFIPTKLPTLRDHYSKNVPRAQTPSCIYLFRSKQQKMTFEMASYFSILPTFSIIADTTVFDTSFRACLVSTLRYLHGKNGIPNKSNAVAEN